MASEVDLEFEFSLKVGVRLDYSPSDSKVDEYLEVVLAYCQIDPDVRYDFVAAENRDENRLDFQPERRKIEILICIRFVFQPISNNLSTVKRILLDLCWTTDRELFYRDCESNEVENLRLDAVFEVE